MLPTTVSVGHFPKARSDTCPLGLPSFPGRGRQRIPQMKVKLFAGSGEGLLRKKKNQTVCGSAAGLSSLLGPILRVPGRRHCGFPGEALVRERMYLIKYGFNGSIPFSSLHIADSLIYLKKKKKHY